MEMVIPFLFVVIIISVSEVEKMILTIISICLVVVGLLLWFFAYDNIYDYDVLGGLILIVGISAVIICSTMLIRCRVCVSYTIEQNKIEYDTLCERLEIAQSEYEDVSKSDVLKDIGIWNKKVSKNKYFSENIWTNWFLNKKVVDQLEYIEVK